MNLDQQDAPQLPQETLELLENALRADLAAVTPPASAGLREHVLANLAPRRARWRRPAAVAAGLLLALSASFTVAHFLNRPASPSEEPLSVARLLPDMGELMERHADRVDDRLAQPLLREVELLAEDTDRVAAAFLRSLPAPLLKGLPASVAARVSPR
ncbi:MAG: hypothetical protein CMJ84_05130 [Planctomycetes bacterium]|nr:hypothetical protein [Planctomycetota bacterium]MDP6408117.1 hypothetical protein [Planctomycetota bacterium]